METGLQTFEFEKGKVFVSGLFWLPLSNIGAKAQKSEIQKIAQEQNFDLMVIRSTVGNPQVGLGTRKEGGRVAMMSVAAMISKTVEVEGHGRAVLCAMQVTKDKWLYVAQRDGLILHDGDLIGSQDTIRKKLESELSTGDDWQMVFAPAEWGIPGAIDRPFRDFIPTKNGKPAYKQWWTLRPVKRSIADLKQFAPFVVLVILGIAVALGYEYWQKYKAQREIEEMAARQAAELEAARKAIKPVYPWTSIPRALEFAELCKNAMQGVKTFWPGQWTFNGTTCEGDMFAVSWSKEPLGTIAHLQEIIPSVGFSADGTQASLVVKFSLPKESENEEKIPAARQRMLEMQKAAEKYGYKIIFPKKQEPQMLPGDQRLVAQQNRGWQELSWSAEGEYLSPFDILTTMDAAGFRVTSISTRYANGTMGWSMKGIQYVQP